MTKRLIKMALKRLGYQITRRQPDSLADNPFLQIKRLVRAKTPIIFDVGAYHGKFSMRFRQLFPVATVYAFEPFPESYAQLRKNTAADPMIRTFNVGFADVAGTRLFSSNRFSATNSLLESGNRGADAWGKGFFETACRLKLPFSTIDLFVGEHHIPSIDILKLDVQGAEYLVLKGAEQSISASRISVIVSEIITHPTYKNQKELYEMLSLFYNYGFQLHNIFDLLRRSDGKLRQFDAIFVRDQQVLTEA